MIDVMPKTKDRKKGPVLSEKRARLMRLICTGTGRRAGAFSVGSCPTRSSIPLCCR